MSIADDLRTTSKLNPESPTGPGTWSYFTEQNSKMRDFVSRCKEAAKSGKRSYSCSFYFSSKQDQAEYAKFFKSELRNPYYGFSDINVKKWNGEDYAITVEVSW